MESKGPLPGRNCINPSLVSNTDIKVIPICLQIGGPSLRSKDFCQNAIILNPSINEAVDEDVPTLQKEGFGVNDRHLLDWNCKIPTEFIARLPVSLPDFGRVMIWNENFNPLPFLVWFILQISPEKYQKTRERRFCLCPYFCSKPKSPPTHSQTNLCFQRTPPPSFPSLMSIIGSIQTISTSAWQPR